MNKYTKTIDKNLTPVLEKLLEAAYEAGRQDEQVLTAILFWGSKTRPPNTFDQKLIKAKAAQYVLDTFEDFEDGTNAAGWKFNEQYHIQVGEPLSNTAFNRIKSILNETIKKYLETAANEQ